MKLKAYLTEGYQIKSLLSHIPPAWVSKKHLNPATKKKVMKDLWTLLKPTYFKSIPLDQMFKILEKHGMVPLQEDNTYWSGLLIGGSKKTEMVTFPLGWKDEDVSDRGIKRYMAVPNSVLTMSYYKMDASGKFEVIAYVS
jgi:hypothetical protein